MKLYIVMLATWNIIESVWDTPEGAKKACVLHSKESKVPVYLYEVIERKLNTLKREIE